MIYTIKDKIKVGGSISMNMPCTNDNHNFHVIFRSSADNRFMLVSDPCKPLYLLTKAVWDYIIMSVIATEKLTDDFCPCSINRI